MAGQGVRGPLRSACGKQDCNTQHPHLAPRQHQQPTAAIRPLPPTSPRCLNPVLRYLSTAWFTRFEPHCIPHPHLLGDGVLGQRRGDGEAAQQQHDGLGREGEARAKTASASIVSSLKRREASKGCCAAGCGPRGAVWCAAGGAAPPPAPGVPCGRRAVRSGPHCPNARGTAASTRGNPAA